MRKLVNILSLLAFVICFVYAGAGYAQTSNGTVIGAVTDASGGAVVGAKVTVTSVETGATRQAITNQEGAYRIESVLPGTYSVTGSAAGYSSTTNNGLVVPGTTIVTANLVLQVGQTSQVVQVTADNTNLNTDNAEISGTLSALEINNLPVETLNPYELALTLPGVTAVTQGAEGNGVSFDVGGDRPRGNNFLIEGQDNNDAGITGQGLQPENLQAYAEVKVLEDNYTAEYGHGAGSVSNLILKSGTNQFHGAVYERADNSSLDTVDKQDHFNQVTPSKYRENFPGFDIGGPIIRNKLFAFGSYQWDFYRSTANLNVLDIPTTAGYATLKALPSNPRLNTLLAAWGGLVGTINSNNLQPSIALGPNPTTGVDRGTVQVGTTERSLGADSNSPEMDLTSDYIISQKDSLRLHLIRASYLAPYDTFSFPGQLPGFDSDQNGVAYNAGIEETHIFSANLVNELRLSYGRIGFTFGLPGSTLSNPLYDAPAVSISNLTGYGIPDSVPQGRFHDTYQLQDTVSWTRGKHLWKVGADISNVRVRDQIPFNYYGTISYDDDTDPSTYPNSPAGSSFTYTGLANLIDDYGGPSTDTVEQNFGNPDTRPNLYSQNYFVEDTYRPIAPLSVDIGFRYEYNGAPFNAPGTPYPGINESNIGCYPSATVNCDTREQADGSEWGPRFGLAYSPTLSSKYKTVVRSGFGVFYDVVFTNIIDNIQAAAPNGALPVIYSAPDPVANNNRGTASWMEQFANLNPSPLPTNEAEPIKDHLLYPRTLHWNLDLEQELPGASSVTISYVGERGEHLYGNTNLNPFVNDWIYTSRVIPTRGMIVVRDNSGDSEYSGLWAQFDHKFNRSLLFRAAYTYSKLMDDSSEVFTFNNESSYQFSRYPTPRGTTDWGPSSYDHKQRLVLSYVWQPPVWHTEGAMKVAGNVVNHWAIAGVTQFQSGSPLNVEDGYDTDGDGISNDRPVLGNPKAPMDTYAFDDSWYYGVGYSDGGLCSGPSLWYTNLPCETVTSSQVHWIIPAAGTHPANPVGRNTLFTPGFQQWDMNISRDFHLYEHASLALRGEFFDIFNHGALGMENSLISPSVPNSTLITGINTDAWSNNGTNTFDNGGPQIVGHRHVRLAATISF